MAHRSGLKSAANNAGPLILQLNLAPHSSTPYKASRSKFLRPVVGMQSATPAFLAGRQLGMHALHHLRGAQAREAIGAFGRAARAWECGAMHRSQHARIVRHSSSSVPSGTTVGGITLAEYRSRRAALVRTLPPGALAIFPGTSKEFITRDIPHRCAANELTCHRRVPAPWSCKQVPGHG